MSSGKTHGLPIPPPTEPPSVPLDVVRVWASDGRLQMDIAVTMWDDPAAWGIMLADLAKKIAEELQMRHGLSRQQILDRLRDGWEDEWQHIAGEEP